MNILGDVVKLISKLPPEGLALLGKLVRALVGSPDPMRAVQRAAIAAGAEKATEEALKKALGRKR